jgi:uncharacterized protein YjbI with pentapeptide repeats
VDFSGAGMKNSVLDNNDFYQAVFEQTDLENADFRQARNFNIDPEKNNIRNAKFSIEGALQLLKKYHLNIDF